MTLMELQKVLGDRIAIHSDLEMDPDKRKKQIETSDIIARLSKQMINNADVVLRANKLIDDGKLVDSSIQKMISSEQDKNGDV